MGDIKLVISDFDKTFTDKSLLVEESMANAIRSAKKNGVRFCLVSGRSYDFLVDYCEKLDGLIDAFVAENGCIGYMNGKKYLLGNCPDRTPIFEGLDRRGVAYGIGEVLFAVGLGDEEKLMEVLSGSNGSFHVIKNVHTLMVLPRGISKESGAAWLAGKYSISPRETAAIGDAENDVDLGKACSLLGAVANAVPEMKAASGYVCRESYGKGVREFLEFAANPDFLK